MKNKKEILKFLKENKSYIQNKFNVKKIAIFGSYARDEANKNSDLDILVDMESSFEKFFDLKYFLEDNLKINIDLGKEKTIRAYIKEKIKDELIYV